MYLPDSIKWLDNRNQRFMRRYSLIFSEASLWYPGFLRRDHKKWPNSCQPYLCQTIWAITINRYNLRWVLLIPTYAAGLFNILFLLRNGLSTLPLRLILKILFIYCFILPNMFIYNKGFGANEEKFIILRNLPKIFIRDHLKLLSWLDGWTWDY